MSLEGVKVDKAAIWLHLQNPISVFPVIIFFLFPSKAHFLWVVFSLGLHRTPERSSSSKLEVMLFPTCTPSSFAMGVEMGPRNNRMLRTLSIGARDMWSFHLGGKYYQFKFVKYVVSLPRLDDWDWEVWVNQQGWWVPWHKDKQTGSLQQLSPTTVLYVRNTWDPRRDGSGPRTCQSAFPTRTWQQRPSLGSLKLWPL